MYLFILSATFPSFGLCLSVLIQVTHICVRKLNIIIPWICYERSFSEFYLSIWNQLVFNQRLQLFVQSPQPYLLIFAWRNQVFSQHIGEKTNEYLNSTEQIPRNWSTFYVNYFLRYYLMMQHQPIVKRVNCTHEWAHRPYQLLIIAAYTNTGG